MVACDYQGRTGGPLCELRFEEDRSSRQTIETQTGRAYVLKFHCLGTDDEELVRCRANDINLGVWPVFRGVPKSRITLLKIGFETWEVTAEYGFIGAGHASLYSDGPPLSMSFSTTGGSQTITQSLSTEATVFNDETPAIGFDGKRVIGVDVVVPKIRWSEVWLFEMQEIFNIASPGSPMFQVIKPGDMNCAQDYELEIPNTLYHMWRWATGSISKAVEENDDYDYPEAYDGSFRGHELGEVLFLGVTARNVAHYRMEVTFEFEMARNRHFCFQYQDPENSTNQKQALQFAKGFDVVDYKWGSKGQTVTETAQGASGSRKQKVPYPIECLVHEVYPRFDFRRLGIGTADMSIGLRSIFSNIPDCDYASAPDSNAPALGQIVPQHEKSGVLWDQSLCSA